MHRRQKHVGFPRIFNFRSSDQSFEDNSFKKNAGNLETFKIWRMVIVEMSPKEETFLIGE